MDELQKKPKRSIVGLTVEEMTPEEVVSLRVLEPKLMDRLYQLTTELKMESPYFKNGSKSNKYTRGSLGLRCIVFGRGSGVLYDGAPEIFES